MITHQIFIHRVLLIATIKSAMLVFITSGFVAFNIATISYFTNYAYFCKCFCRGDEVDEDESKKVLKMLQTSVSSKHVSYL